MLQGILQDLTEIDIPFQCGGVEPRGKRDGAADRLVHAGKADRRHIGIDQNDTLVLFWFDGRKCGRRGDGFTIFFQTTHHTTKKFAGGEERVLFARAACGDAQIWKIDRDLLPFFIDEYRRIEIAVRQILFHTENLQSNQRNFKPDCCSIRFNVGLGISLSGSFTVTRPVLVGCLNWW
nr:MAG TPA_asm: hypothetical protein [Caudoviricetes sp.]